MSYDKVSLLLPMNGANNGTEFPDFSPVPKTIAVSGAITSTAQSKFYGSSGFFDGTNDRVNATIGYAIGTSDFAVEAWVRVTASGSYQTIFTTRTDAPVSEVWFGVNTGNLRLIVFTNVAVLTTTDQLTAGTWHHVALVRSSGTMKIYIDGVEKATASNSTNFLLRTMGIGMTNDVSPFPFNGYMQDARVSTYARYTAAFTPPAKMTGFISNAAVGASKILDAAGNPAERTVFAVLRITPVRVFSDVSNASGEFEIQAPAGDHSVVALADEADLYNDLVARVIPV